MSAALSDHPDRNHEDCCLEFGRAVYLAITAQHGRDAALNMINLVAFPWPVGSDEQRLQEEIRRTLMPLIDLLVREGVL